MATSEEQRLLERIRLDPYFSVRIIPGTRDEEMSLAEARKLVVANAVSLRGWDFPFVNQKSVFNAGKYVGCTTDWERHRELWRMYRSGQFIYLANIWDVSFDFQAQLRRELNNSVLLATAEQKARVAGITTFINIIYFLTEIYVFAGRLAAARLPRGNMHIRVVLHNVELWSVGAGDARVPWHAFYQSRVEVIDASAVVPSADLIDNAAIAAVPAIKELFAGFNWDNAADGMIKQWQDRLLTGQFAV